MSGPESMKPDDHLLEEFLAGQGAVRAAYGQTASAQPPPALDAAILQLAGRTAAPTLLPRAARRRWQLPMATAAVLMLSLGVLLQVQRDQVVQRQLMAPPDQAAPAASAPIEAVADVAPPQALAATQPALEKAAVEKKQAAAHSKPALRAEKRPPAPPPPAAPAPQQQAAMVDAPAAEPLSHAAAPGAMAQDSMPHRERSGAPIAKAQANRSTPAVAAFAAPVEPAAEAMADAQPSLPETGCPARLAGQLPAIDSATGAIAVARPLLIQRFGAEVIAPYEPLKGEQSGAHWLVKGSQPEGIAGGAPEVELCASTGTALRIQHGHKAE